MTAPSHRPFRPSVSLPGLAKTKGLALVATRSAQLARANDGPWKDALSRADTLSEGGIREEESGLRWYGSTSLIVPLPTTNADEQALCLRVASQDVHVRLRAMRIARDEAALRAPNPLGTLACEVRFSQHPLGLRIDVDVEAPLLALRTAHQSPKG